LEKEVGVVGARDEAIKRREKGEETMREIAQSYNV
jgi:hypothetical protein